MAAVHQWLTNLGVIAGMGRSWSVCAANPASACRPARVELPQTQRCVLDPHSSRLPASERLRPRSPNPSPLIANATESNTAGYR